MVRLPLFEKHCDLYSFAEGGRNAIRTLVLLLTLWL